MTRSAAAGSGRRENGQYNHPDYKVL